MSQPFGAALLAGGRSRRMGTDKAFLRVGDPPEVLWERQLRMLKSLGAEQVLLSHNVDQEFGELPGGVELVVDSPGDCGPLGGVVSCLRRTECDRLLVLAVDLPFVKLKFLQGLVDHGGGVAVQSAGGKHFEAVVAVYTQGCLAIAEAQLERGEYAMQKFILDCIADGLLCRRLLAGGEQEQLKNLNRPEDL